MRSQSAFALLAVLPAVMIPTAAAQSSLLAVPAPGWNGIFLTARVEAGFRQAGMPAGLTDSNVSQNSAGVLPDRPAGEVIAVAPTSATVVPTFGETKDIATATVGYSFTVGSATTPDRFDFDIDSTTSAVAAGVDFGAGPEAADSFVKVTITLESFSPLSVPGATITLPDMPELTDPSTESLSATFNVVSEGGVLAGFLRDGDPGFDLPLFLPDPGDRFSYILEYEIVTPFGSDPEVSYSFTGGTSVADPEVPEPRITATRVVDANTFELTFESVAGRDYGITRGTGLEAFGDEVVISATSDSTVFTRTGSPLLPREFFRVTDLGPTP